MSVYTKEEHSIDEWRTLVRSVLVGDGRDDGRGGPPKEKRLVDTKAGFFIEEDEGGGTEEDGATRNLVSLPAPITKPDRPECEECGEAVAESFLLRTFDLSVCDSCKGRTDQTQKGVEPLYK